MMNDFGENFKNQKQPSEVFCKKVFLQENPCARYNVCLIKLQALGVFLWILQNF